MKKKIASVIFMLCVVMLLAGCRKTAKPLQKEAASSEESGNAPYMWEDGVLFSITKSEKSRIMVQKSISFDAEKWRSPMGAYYFSDCVARWKINGSWKDYQVGHEAIS